MKKSITPIYTNPRFLLASVLARRKAFGKDPDVEDYISLHNARAEHFKNMGFDHYKKAASAYLNIVDACRHLRMSVDSGSHDMIAFNRLVDRLTRSPTLHLDKIEKRLLILFGEAPLFARNAISSMLAHAAYSFMYKDTYSSALAQTFRDTNFVLSGYPLDDSDTQYLIELRTALLRIIGGISKRVQADGKYKNPEFISPLFSATELLTKISKVVPDSEAYASAVHAIRLLETYDNRVLGIYIPGAVDKISAFNEQLTRCEYATCWIPIAL